MVFEGTDRRQPDLKDRFMVMAVGMAALCQAIVTPLIYWVANTTYENARALAAIQSTLPALGDRYTGTDAIRDFGVVSDQLSVARSERIELRKALDELMREHR